MNLKEKRIAAGITQTALAEQLNVSQAAVAVWETGEAKPTVDKLPKLAELLGCTIDDLFNKPSNNREEIPTIIELKQNEVKQKIRDQVLCTTKKLSYENLLRVLDYAQLLLKVEATEISSQARDIIDNLDK